MLIYRLFWPWRKPDVEFTTVLSITQCRERLKKSVAYKQGLFHVHSDNPVMGKIEGDNFHFSKIPKYRDDFRPVLYGTLSPTQYGTSVRALLRLDNAIILLYVVGYSIFLTLIVRDILLMRAAWWTLLVFALFLEILAAFMWLVSWSRKSNRDYLVEYLHRVLEE